MPTSRVVVGVDGSAGSRAALLWAAGEAHLRRVTLLVVTAIHDPADAGAADRAGRNRADRIGLDRIDRTGRPDLSTRTDRTAEDVGERLLRAAATMASARQPQVPVTTALARGCPAETLVELSDRSDLVVVGVRGGSGSVSSILGSVTHRVAARAHCPVAVVPMLPRPDHTDRHGIVVGLSGSATSDDALAFGIAEARLRHSTVTAVTARSPGAPDLPTAPGAPEPSTEATAATAGGHGRPPVETEPDALSVDTAFVSADPVDALLDAARSAELLVIGSHLSENRFSIRLGPVPSVLIHRAPCPVVVVGQRRAAALPEATPGRTGTGR